MANSYASYWAFIDIGSCLFPDFLLEEPAELQRGSVKLCEQYSPCFHAPYGLLPCLVRLIACIADLTSLKKIHATTRSNEARPDSTLST